MVDNSESILVDYDYNNIIVVDPNKVVDTNGDVKERYVKQENLVIYANLECNVLPRTKLAVGSSNTTATSSPTALGGELGSVVLDSTVRAANTVTYVATFPAGTGTGSLTEAGILNASSSGNLLCRTVFGVVTKAAGDTVVITWNVTVA